jgi:gamma-glutamyltranspeptidase/glutathione hydrolase
MATTETPVFMSAAVAAPHNLAAEAGRNVLIEGGNALEAMVAMAATIAVVYPHMTAIGGDSFWVVREAKGRMHLIEACGPAGSLATIERYRALGHDIVPVRGPLAALTVPGTIGGWAMALEAAKALGGRVGLKDLLANAVGHARNGYPVSSSETRAYWREPEALRAAPGFGETFLFDGEKPKVGQARKVGKLADVLEHIGHAGLDDFYRGDVGREIAGDLERIGAPIVRSDLERYRPQRRAPLSLDLDGVTVFNTPPPTLGLASLLILGIFERLNVRVRDSFEHVHGLVEATKRAMAISAANVTDFDRMTREAAHFLEPHIIEREADRIDMRRAAGLKLEPAEADTVWMGAVDGNGLCVSMIQSIFWDYGSGCVLQKTGILMQNRGISFSLDPDAVNPLEPGRRPPHTLNPAMAVFDDGRVMPYGTQGGDGQPQIQAQVFTRIARFGMGLAEALDAPRWRYGAQWRQPAPTLKLESRFDPSLVAALEKAGHDIELTGTPYADQFGHAGALVRHPRGHVEAAHDPRADGGAAGV